MFEFLQFIRNRQEIVFLWTLNIFLAAVILLNAEAGRLVGVSNIGPLKISAVWPATGFSLAALMLFGSRVWSGIFFGNLAYNAFHILQQAQDDLGPFLAALFVSFGSLVQALAGWYIIHRFSSKGYFKSVKDVVVFLIGGGMLTCTIASSIGVTTLYCYGTLPVDHLFTVWLTFWLGDCLGIYAFTPFLIVWSIHKLKKTITRQLGLEAIFMVVSFLAIVWAGLIRTYPIVDLFIPLSIWVAYQFGMHGTSLLTIFITLVSIISTSLGYGSVAAYFPQSSLLVLVTFIEIIVATALMVAAMIRERDHII